MGKSFFMARGADDAINRFEILFLMQVEKPLFTMQQHLRCKNMRFDHKTLQFRRRLHIVTSIMLSL